MIIVLEVGVSTFVNEMIMETLPKKRKKVNSNETYNFM